MKNMSQNEYVANMQRILCKCCKEYVAKWICCKCCKNADPAGPNQSRFPARIQIWWLSSQYRILVASEQIWNQFYQHQCFGFAGQADWWKQLWWMGGALFGRFTKTALWGLIWLAAPPYCRWDNNGCWTVRRGNTVIWCFIAPLPRHPPPWLGLFHPPSDPLLRQDPFARWMYSV